MKAIFLLLLANLLFADIVELPIPKNSEFNKLPVVTVFKEYTKSGCSNEEIKIPAIYSKTLNAYVVGNEQEVPKALGLPFSPGLGCQAVVTIVEYAEFPVYGNPGVITLVIPDESYGYDVEVRTFPVY